MRKTAHEERSVPEIKQSRLTMPMIVLRGVGVFPKMLVTFDVDRKASVSALNNANRHDRMVFLACLRDPMTDIHEEKDIHRIGVVCRIRQLLQQPGSSVWHHPDM